MHHLYMPLFFQSFLTTRNQKLKCLKGCQQLTYLQYQAPIFTKDSQYNYTSSSTLYPVLLVVQCSWRRVYFLSPLAGAAFICCNSPVLYTKKSCATMRPSSQKGKSLWAAKEVINVMSDKY